MISSRTAKNDSGRNRDGVYLGKGREGGGLALLYILEEANRCSLLMLNFGIMCMKSCLNVAVFFQEKKITKTKQKNLSLSVLNGRLLF